MLAFFTLSSVCRPNARLSKLIRLRNVPLSRGWLRELLSSRMVLVPRRRRYHWTEAPLGSLQFILSHGEISTNLSRTGDGK